MTRADKQVHARERACTICRMRAASLLVVVLSACPPPVDEPTDAGLPDAGTSITDRELPQIFRMTGDATLDAKDGRSVTCSLDLIFEQTTETERTATLVEYAGNHGGEVVRTVENPGGDGFEFHASVAGETVVRLVLPESLEIEIPINDTAENPFFRELNGFGGSIDDDDNMEGTWTCAPLEIDDGGGYVDLDLVAEGTWTAIPQ
jgi:hypothetical protein